MFRLSRIAVILAVLVLALATWAQEPKPAAPQSPASPQSKDAKPAPAPAQSGNVFVIGAPPADKADKPDDPAPAAKPVHLSSQRITMEGRMALIRGLESEFVYLRRTFPMGEKGLVLKNGVVAPDNATLQQLVAKNGSAGKPGDRGQITNIELRDHSIYFELNGGPKKKTKWYERIQVGTGGQMASAAPPDGAMAKGSSVTVEFDKFVPDMTTEQAKQVLAPVFDFSTRSAVQSYAETLPPKVKDAITNHQVLVGMNRELVQFAKGRPDQKVRERDGDVDYEEWIYGTPPQQVSFVRFVGDEVVQVKLMSVDGTREVHTTKEIDMKELTGSREAAAVAQAKTKPADAAADPNNPDPTQAGPSKKPTLRRADDPAPLDDRGPNGPPGGDQQPARPGQDPNRQDPNRPPIQVPPLPSPVPTPPQ